MHLNQFLTLTLTTLLTITTITAALTINFKLIKARDDLTTPALQATKRGLTNSFIYSGDGYSGIGYAII